MPSLNAFVCFTILKMYLAKTCLCLFLFCLGGSTNVLCMHLQSFYSGCLVGKESACNVGDPSSIPGWGRFPSPTRPPCPSPTPGVHWLTSIKSVMPSSHLILCCPLLLLPPIPSSIRVFSNESTLRMRWPKSWSFSFSVIPSKEIPGLVSFRMDWLDLLAVQGTLKSLLQHHSSKASILRRSAFFTVQISHPYMTTGKTIALTRRTFVGKVMFWICYLGWS